MELTIFEIILKIITWTGGVFISIWIIKLLREINSKQKEYIILVENAFKEREKTRDQKIELLDLSHKKEIELIEKEKSIIIKTIEIEKKNLELQISQKPKDNDVSLLNTILELKTDLSSSISKLSSMNFSNKDLKPLREFIGITSNINRKANYISYQEGESYELVSIKIEKFIMDFFDKGFYNLSGQVVFDKSLSNLKPILFNYEGFNIILSEILANAQRYSYPQNLKIYGHEDDLNTQIVFENPIANNNYTEISGGLGLKVIQQILEQYKYKVDIVSEGQVFQLKLNFLKK